MGCNAETEFNCGSNREGEPQCIPIEKVNRSFKGKLDPLKMMIRFVTARMTAATGLTSPGTSADITSASGTMEDVTRSVVSSQVRA